MEPGTGWRQGYSVGSVSIHGTGLEKRFNIHLRGPSRRCDNYGIRSRSIEGVGLETGIPILQPRNGLKWSLWAGVHAEVPSEAGHGH